MSLESAYLCNRVDGAHIGVTYMKCHIFLELWEQVFGELGM